MEPADGDGWAELQNDGSLEGEIRLLNGDVIPFTACRSKTSSTPGQSRPPTGTALDSANQIQTVSTVSGQTNLACAHLERLG